MALDLPPAALAELQILRPAPAPGLRIPPADQTHLTLHFLGEADPRRVADALEPVAVSDVPLELEKVGVFTSPNGAVTLWAGVRISPELAAPRSAIASALAPAGFRPEARPYTPHITLGRYEAGAAEPVVNAFLSRSADFPRMCGSSESFGLYSSSFVDQAPVYRRERSFPARSSPAR